MYKIQDIITIDGNEYQSCRVVSQRLNRTHQQLSNTRAYDRILIKQGKSPTGPAWIKLQQSGYIYYQKSVIDDYLIPKSINTASAVVCG